MNPTFLFMCLNRKVLVTPFLYTTVAYVSLSETITTIKPIKGDNNRLIKKAPAPPIFLLLPALAKIMQRINQIITAINILQ